MNGQLPDTVQGCIMKGAVYYHGLLLGDEALLSETHGFPVRLILPGYPGQNMIKQLDRIRVHREAQPFDPDLVLLG